MAEIFVSLLLIGGVSACTIKEEPSSSFQSDESSISPISSEKESSDESTVSSEDISGQTSKPSSADGEHSYESEVIIKATIIEKGKKKYTCTHCGDVYDGDYYDLDELAFEDQSFMYDGNEHELTIKGMLPLGVKVEYSDNKLKDIGSKSVTASFYDDEHNLLLTKTAKLSIIENKGMPNIYIDTNNVEIADKENYVTMTLSTSNYDEKHELNNVAGGIRLRGNGTLTYDKKAYRIKFSSKNNVFGLNNGAALKSWVLLAEYADQSMVRNATSFYLGNSLFNYSNNYCSDYKHVNVYLNGEYNGVYLLAEQQQINTKRINIVEPSKGDTGTDIGYLLELDNYATKEDFYFNVGTVSSGQGQWGQQNNNDRVGNVTIPGKYYTVKTDLTNSTTQLPYIKNYLTNLQKVFVNAANKTNLYVLDENNNLVASPFSTAYETISSVVDLESMMKMYVLHELMKNVDVGFSSFYMFVDFSTNSKYPKLTFGAPWDFDWSSGNCNKSPYQTSNGAYNSTNFDHMNPWFYMLSKMDFFNEYIKKYYQVFNNSDIFKGMISQANYIADAFKDDFANNYNRWKTLGTIIPAYTPNDVTSFKVHKDAVNHLINWLNNRKTYLDNTFLK